jgi:hypothetical protein
MSNYFGISGFESSKCEPNPWLIKPSKHEKEFSCVEAKVVKFGFFKTSEFGVSEVVRMNDRGTVEWKTRSRKSR